MLNNGAMNLSFVYRMETAYLLEHLEVIIGKVIFTNNLNIIDKALFLHFDRIVTFVKYMQDPYLYYDKIQQTTNTAFIQSSIIIATLM